MGVSIVHTSGKKIKDELVNTRGKETNVNSAVYEIPCGGCDKKYYGETARGMEKRIKEHRNDLRHNRESNSLVIHATRSGHLPAWKDVRTLHSGLEKKKRRTLEAAYIATEPATNHREGFIKLAGTAARILKETAIRRKRENQSPSSTPQ